jgi:hypothetical protein
MTISDVETGEFIAKKIIYDWRAVPVPVPFGNTLQKINIDILSRPDQSLKVLSN